MSRITNRICLVTMEDDVTIASQVNEMVRTALNNWIFFRRGIFEWYRASGVENDPEAADIAYDYTSWLSKRDAPPDDVTVLSTLDLEVPFKHGAIAVSGNGERAIQRCADVERFPVCVISSRSDFLRAFEGVPFLRKPAGRGMDGDLRWNAQETERFVEAVRDLVLSTVRRISFEDPCQPSMRRVVLLKPDLSNRLRDIYLFEVPAWAEREEFAAPLLLEAAPGIGASMLLRYMACLCGAGLREIDLGGDLPVETILTQIGESRAALADLNGKRGLTAIRIPRHRPGTQTDEEKERLEAATEELFEDATRICNQQTKSNQRVVFVIPPKEVGPVVTMRRSYEDHLLWLRQHSSPDQLVILPDVRKRGREYIRAFSEMILQEVVEVEKETAEEQVVAQMDYRLGKFFMGCMDRGHQALGGNPNLRDLKRELINLAEESGSLIRGGGALTTSHFLTASATSPAWKRALDEDLKDDILVMDDVRLNFPSSGEPVTWVVGTRNESFNLSVEHQDCLAIVGPSGCGKSSLLRMIAGLQNPSDGSVSVQYDREARQEREVITAPGPDRGMVFQAYTCFPWLTVVENVAFGLRLLRDRGVEVREAAEKALEDVGLTEFRDAYPRTLSGGQRQRVAIARSIAQKPRILLMDEPFGALDAETRFGMQDMLNRIRADHGLTVVIVTHDVDEAIFLGDTVCVCSPRPLRRLAEFPINFPHRNKTTKRSRVFQELERDIHEKMREWA